MLITMTNTLSTEQTEDIQRLHALCAAHDGTNAVLALDASMNFDPNLPAFYLGMEDENLVAFLMVFAPDSTEAEIIAFTAPSYRRRGYFRALLAQAAEQLRSRGVRRLLLQCDAAGADGRDAMAAMAAKYEYSEYAMIRPLSDLPAVDAPLLIAEAAPGELEELSVLAADINQDDPDFYRSMLGKAMATTAMTVYSAWLEGQRAGMCRVIWDETPPGICTLGIRPDLRGRGLGEALLHLVLREIAGRGHDAATLDVDSGNTAALSLYRKAGFQIKTQIDFYELRQ